MERRRRRGPWAPTAVVAFVALVGCSGDDHAPEVVACDRLGDLLEAIRASGNARSEAEVAEIVITPLGRFVEAAAATDDRELVDDAATVDAAVSAYAAGVMVPTGVSVDTAITRASDRCFALGATVDLPDPP